MTTEPGEEELAKLVAACAHELRTPVASFRTFLDVLIERWDSVDSATQAEITAQLHSDLDRMTRMVDDLTDAGRIKAHALAMDVERVALDELLGRLVAGFRARNPYLRTKYQSVPIEASVDPIRVEQMVGNFLDNIERHADGASVFVQLSRVGGNAEILVLDDGPGIPRDRAGDAFRAFSTGLGRTRGRAGLGLWISKALAEAHGGSLTLEENSPAGCCVRLTLPVSPPPTLDRSR